MLNSYIPTKDDLKNIAEQFVNADISLIKSIIYNDGWSGYEDAAGYLIFYGIDDSIQLQTWNYSCAGGDGPEYWNLQDITEDEAIERMIEMNKLIKEDYCEY